MSSRSIRLRAAAVLAGGLVACLGAVASADESSFGVPGLPTSLPTISPSPLPSLGQTPQPGALLEPPTAEPSPPAATSSPPPGAPAPEAPAGISPGAGSLLAPPSPGPLPGAGLRPERTLLDGAGRYPAEERVSVATFARRAAGLAAPLAAPLGLAAIGVIGLVAMAQGSGRLRDLEEERESLGGRSVIRL